MPTGIYIRTKSNIWKGKKRPLEIGRKISASLFGRKLSDYHKQRISESHKGQQQSPKNKEALRVARSRTRSVESRFKSSKSAKLRVASGKHNWGSGKLSSANLLIRKSVEYKLWRESVFRRDNYTCVWCEDNSGGNLEADHIKPFASYPELRFALDNGRTLCHNCHKTTITYLTNSKSKQRNLKKNR